MLDPPADLGQPDQLGQRGVLGRGGQPVVGSVGLVRRASTPPPGLRGALLAARASGHPHLSVDGTLLRTGRYHAPGPTARVDLPERRVDLWWSGEHTCRGGDVYVIAATGWLAAVDLGYAAGGEHDTTGLRADREVLALLAEWTDTTDVVLADLGYEEDRGALTTPIKHSAGRRLTTDERTVNLLHAATRAPAERGNSLHK